MASNFKYYVHSDSEKPKLRNWSEERVLNWVKQRVRNVGEGKELINYLENRNRGEWLKLNACVEKMATKPRSNFNQLPKNLLSNEVLDYLNVRSHFLSQAAQSLGAGAQYKDLMTPKRLLEGRLLDVFLKIGLKHLIPWKEFTSVICGKNLDILIE